MVSFPEILDDHPKWEESVVAYDNRTLSRRGPVKMAGYWPSFALYCPQLRVGPRKTHKCTWPIFSHLDLTRGEKLIYTMTNN